VTLRLSDPAYTARLAAFFDDLGYGSTRAADGAVELEREIPREELEVYLRVWSVLEPLATVTVEGGSEPESGEEPQPNDS
jgi:hypothetical protein